MTMHHTQNKIHANAFAPCPGLCPSRQLHADLPDVTSWSHSKLVSISVSSVWNVHSSDVGGTISLPSGKSQLKCHLLKDNLATPATPHSPTPYSTLVSFPALTTTWSCAVIRLDFLSISAARVGVLRGRDFICQEPCYLQQS